MTPDNFVRSLRQVCRDAAVTDCVASFEHPPGRKPSDELTQLSQWFNRLSQTDRAFVIAAMRRASDATLFGTLCVIDGVRTIEPRGEKSHFKLTAICGDIESQLSPNESFLHDIYRAEP